MNEKVMNICQKLAKARVMFQQMAKRTGKVKFGAREYVYFELDDILPRVNEINQELGLLSAFSLSESDGMRTGTLTLINSENPGETLTFSNVSAVAKIQGSEIQAIGAEITYIKRYCYQNAYEIAEPDMVNPAIAAEGAGKTDKKNVDTGGKTSPKQATRQSAEEPIHPDTLEKIRMMIDAFEEPELEKNALKSIGARRFEDISERQGQKMMTVLERRMKSKLEEQDARTR